ncbi:LysR family transcriptional regulator [Kineosporia sp. NBRC 101677]|nr:LysR family transcriptional regulator [Kineosporia sp. NBRC 101677]
MLEAFMRVYQRGSITAAAADLGVSQPALTDRIARLETRLGLKLFERSRRGTRPTASAERLAAQVGEPLGRLREVLRPEAVEPSEVVGSLRLGGPAEIMALRVLPSLAPLLGAGLQVHITLGQAEHLLTALAEQELDLVVSAVRPKRPGLAAVPLFDEEFLLVGTASQARSIDPAELQTRPVAALAHLPLVAYADDLPIVRRYWRTLFGQRPPNRVALTVPDLRAVLAAVAAGVGISVLPRYIARPALEAGSIQMLHRGEELPLNTGYLAWRAGEETQQPLAAVREHLLRVSKDWGSL